MTQIYFFFQAEDGIRDLVRSRGLGDVYKRQVVPLPGQRPAEALDVDGQAADPGAVVGKYFEYLHKLRIQRKGAKTQGRQETNAVFPLRLSVFAPLR